MGLLKKLQTLGCQLKLVQMVPRTETVPGKISTRSVTLQELTTELQAENMRILAESAVELAIDFVKVFETAGITPPACGWTIEQLVQQLQSKSFELLKPDERLKAVLDRLADEKVLVEEIIKNALAKDQALDAYEIFVSRKMADRSAARHLRLLEIEQERSRLEQEQRRLREEESAEQKHWADWQKRKAAYEKEITEAVEFLMRCEKSAGNNYENHPTTI